MDFIINFPISIKSGAKILLLITDRLNKRIILILILLIFTPVIATDFIDHYITYHRFLKVIINNKGIQFISTVWTIIYKTLGIKRRLFLVYYPEINGAIERGN